MDHTETIDEGFWEPDDDDWSPITVICIIAILALAAWVIFS